MHVYKPFEKEQVRGIANYFKENKIKIYDV